MQINTTFAIRNDPTFPFLLKKKKKAYYIVLESKILNYKHTY